MARLSTNEKQVLEKLFQMGGGYVLNFSDRTIGEFFHDDVGINIYNERYNYASGSKANRMRGFWQVGNDSQVSGLGCSNDGNFVAKRIGHNLLVFRRRMA